MTSQKVWTERGDGFPSTTMLFSVSMAPPEVVQGSSPTLCSRL